MVPDLPYGRLVVPDDSEGPDSGGRFAQARRSHELRRSPASDGVPRAPFCRARTASASALARRCARWSRSAVCTAVSLSLTGQLATADDLTDRRDELKAQLTKTRSSLNESSASLRRPRWPSTAPSRPLQAAQAALAETRRQLAAADAA